MDGDDTYTYFNIWIRHALLCQARVLTVDLHYEFTITLDDPPLVSRHLRRLELTDIHLKGNILDFASCPALEDLKITSCGIFTDRILSQSVKRLSIKHSSFCFDTRTRISVPSLVSLQLRSFRGRSPLLERIPSLETAFVKPVFYKKDHCNKGDFGECCGVCAKCCGNDDHNGGCVLLGGLSSATNLKLIAYSGMGPKQTMEMEGNTWSNQLLYQNTLRWSKSNVNLFFFFCVVN